MNDRVNKKMPYKDQGVTVYSKLDELMMQYYRVPNGEDGGALHIEAFEIGQKLQFYFATYSTVVVNEMMEGTKIQTPDINIALEGMECPFTLMLDNAFFQNNFQVIIASVLAEITRMNTSRNASDKDQVLAYSLNLCKWEYLSVLAGLVAGSKAQKMMDVELRKEIVNGMDSALEAVRKHSGIK